MVEIGLSGEKKVLKTIVILVPQQLQVQNGEQRSISDEWESLTCCTNSCFSLDKSK
jgi:hypothetical protein